MWMEFGALQNVQNLSFMTALPIMEWAAATPGTHTAGTDPAQHRSPIPQLIKAQPCLRVTQVMNPLQGACWL